jgi:hypothetical protein
MVSLDDQGQPLSTSIALNGYQKNLPTNKETDQSAHPLKMPLLQRTIKNSKPRV